MSNEQLVGDKVVMNSQVFDSAEDEIDLSELLGTLIEAKWLISFIASIFLVGGVFYALIATPIYQADAVLQIEEKSGSMPGLSDFTEMFPVDAQASTEIEIIKSRNIIGKVVDKLDLTLNVAPKYFPVIGAAIARRHNSTGVAESSFGMGDYAWGGERIQVSRLVVPEYITDALTLTVSGTDKYQILTTEGKLLANGVVGKMLRQDGLEIFVSELVARVNTEFSLSRSSKIAVVRNLQSGLKISERKGTGI